MTPGLGTSEFKVALLTVLGGIIAALVNWVSNRYGLGVAGAGAVGYVLSRGFAKTEPRP